MSEREPLKRLTKRALKKENGQGSVVDMTIYPKTDNCDKSIDAQTLLKQIRQLVSEKPLDTRILRRPRRRESHFLS
jgi:hypothetical protein